MHLHYSLQTVDACHSRRSRCVSYIVRMEPKRWPASVGVCGHMVWSHTWCCMGPMSCQPVRVGSYRSMLWPDRSDVDTSEASFMCVLNAYEAPRSLVDVATTSGATARYQWIH